MFATESGPRARLGTAAKSTSPSAQQRKPIPIASHATRWPGTMKTRATQRAPAIARSIPAIQCPADCGSVWTAPVSEMVA